MEAKEEYIATSRSLADDWAEIESFFPTRAAMLPSRAWLNWMSTRLKAGRLKRLYASKRAVQLEKTLSDMDASRVKAMRTYAAINLEQATYGFRFTLVANVTAPVLFLTVLNLMLPDGIAGILSALYGDEMSGLGLTVGFLFGFSILVSMLFYALASLNQARDIRHLIDLYAADRGIFFGLEDDGDLHSP